MKHNGFVNINCHFQYETEIITDHFLSLETFFGYSIVCVVEKSKVDRWNEIA